RTATQRRLADLDKLTDADSISAYLRDAASKGEAYLFDFGPEADFKNSEMNIAYATQGGLGLPDTTYYKDADKKQDLANYEAHVGRVLELSGIPAADAAKQAKDVIAFETRLASKSLSREALQRKVALYYNAVSPADADKLTPGFSWEEFFKSQGIATPKMFSFPMTDFHAEWNKMRSDGPVEQWKSYRRCHIVDEASPF